MTSTNTLSPDTGEIPRLRLSEDKTTDLTFRAHPPLLRRPDATGEIPRILDDAPVQPIFPLERVIDPAADLPTKYVGLHRARPTLADRIQRAAALAVFPFRSHRGGHR